MKKGKKTDVILISPPDDFSRYPYLGLCSMAAVLRKEGISVEMLDCAALNYTKEGILSRIKSSSPKIVAVSVMSMMLRFCHELINDIKKQCPETTVIVGGSHLNAEPGIFSSMHADYGMIGECEYDFTDFCKQVLNGEIPDTNGLITRSNDALSIRKASVIEDISALPFPAYDLLPLEKYYSPSTGNKTISYISSRGCPYNCKYCSKIEKTPYRFIDSEVVLDHMEILVNDLGIKNVEFVDEIFTLNRDRVIQLCEGLIERGISLSWGASTRADRIDEELVKLMEKSGCKKIGFGIETGSERVRFEINKEITNKQIIDAIRICSDNGVKTLGYFIFGHPTETEKDMRETVSFARKIGLNFAYFNKMMPIPNSEVYNIAIKEQSIEENAWTNFMLGKRSHPLYTPVGISEKTINKYFRLAWFSTYLWPKNIWRNRWAILNPGHLIRSSKALLSLSSNKRFDK